MKIVSITSHQLVSIEKQVLTPAMQGKKTLNIITKQNAVLSGNLQELIKEQCITFDGKFGEFITGGTLKSKKLSESFSVDNIQEITIIE